MCKCDVVQTLANILNLSIYISTFIAPLQGNYSEALPVQARPKRRGVYKKNWKERSRGSAAENKGRGKTISNRGTHNRESPFLSGGIASTWHHKVSLGCRAERSAIPWGSKFTSIKYYYNNLI